MDNNSLLSYITYKTKMIQEERIRDRQKEESLLVSEFEKKGFIPNETIL